MGNRQLHELGLQEHPQIADKLHTDDVGKTLWNGSSFSFLPTGLLAPTRVVDRTGADDRGDSEENISRIEDDIRSGRGIRESLGLGYDVNKRSLWLDEGHHRLEAAIRAGAHTVPVIGYRTSGGYANEGNLRIPRGLQPDKYGWSPGHYDPEELIKGLR